MITDSKKKLCVGLSLSPTWRRNISHSLNQNTDISDIYHANFYIQLAQQAEAAGLDFVFKPDTLSLRLPEGSDNENTDPTGSLDPNIIAAAIATQTKHIGIVTTLSTTFNHPFMLARQLMSLNWVSQGRIGWNIVTSIEGDENFGIKEKPTPDDRYDRAAESVAAVHQLWDSFQFVDTANTDDFRSTCIKKIDHVGRYYDIVGPLNTLAYPKARVAIFQAGASKVGKSFAASVADAVFAATPDMATACQLKAELKDLCIDQDRTKPVKVLPGLYFFIGDSQEEAYDAYVKAHEHLDVKYRFKKIVDIIGVDFSHKRLSDTITADDLPSASQPVRSRTHAQLLRRYIEANQPKLSELLNRPEVISSAHWVAFGTAQHIVSEIIDWATADAIDGFIALPGNHNSLQRFYSELMPHLIEKGYCRSSYQQSTLIENLNEV